MSRQGAQEVETVEGEIVADADWLQTVPLVLTANTVNVCVPGLTSTDAESDGEFVSPPRPPSGHACLSLANSHPPPPKSR